MVVRSPSIEIFKFSYVTAWEIQKPFKHRLEVGPENFSEAFWTLDFMIPSLFQSVHLWNPASTYRPLFIIQIGLYTLVFITHNVLAKCYPKFGCNNYSFRASSLIPRAYASKIRPILLLLLFISLKLPDSYSTSFTCWENGTLPELPKVSSLKSRTVSLSLWSSAPNTESLADSNYTVGQLLSWPRVSSLHVHSYPLSSYRDQPNTRIMLLKYRQVQ